MNSTEHKAVPASAFPASSRLNKPADFKEVFRKPLASADAFFKVLARPNQRPISRLGMAVSRKVDKRAVGRNRIKRVIRESFRHHFTSTTRPHLDIVVLPRHQSASICNERLFNSLDKHWSRLESSLRKNTDG